MPKRIQRKRSKGWRMPENTVYVGRPTKWGNPWPVLNGNHAEAVALFRGSWEGVTGIWPMNRVVEDLRGRDLACWCPLGQPCHADVLLEWANAMPPEGGLP